MQGNRNLDYLTPIREQRFAKKTTDSKQTDDWASYCEKAVTNKEENVIAKTFLSHKQSGTVLQLPTHMMT